MNFLIIARPCPMCANASPRWAMARSSCRRCWDGSRRRWGKAGENPMKIHQTIQKSSEKSCLRWFPGGFWDGFDGFSWDFAFRREKMTGDWEKHQIFEYFWWDFEWVLLNFTIRQTSTRTLKWLWPAGSAVVGNTPGLGSDVHPRAHRQRGALSRDGLAGCREGFFSWRPGTGAFPGADIKLDDLGLDFLWWCLMHVVHVLFDMHSFVVWN